MNGGRGAKFGNIYLLVFDSDVQVISVIGGGIF